VSIQTQQAFHLFDKPMIASPAPPEVNIIYLSTAKETELSNRTISDLLNHPVHLGCTFHCSAPLAGRWLVDASGMLRGYHSMLCSVVG